MSVNTAIFSKPTPRHTKPLATAISSRRTAPRFENIDDLKRRVEEASRYIPLAQLAIGPQCGFSTNLIEGVHLTNEIQRAKLTVVAAAAREIWPEG